MYHTLILFGSKIIKRKNKTKKKIKNEKERNNKTKEKKEKERKGEKKCVTYQDHKKSSLDQERNTTHKRKKVYANNTQRIHGSQEKKRKKM